MHQRQSIWFSPGGLRGSDASEQALSYRFDNATVTFSHSHDGWLRVSFFLGPGAREGTEGSQSGPAQRRSWALDPKSAATRRWFRPEVDSPQPVHRQQQRRFDHGHGGVEGEENPHEDTRGVVPVSVTGYRVELPVPGLHADHLSFARSRDGWYLSLPLDAGLRVYGLGEKTGSLDKRGRSWTMWNSDEPDHTPDRDPLYQSIPVAYLFDPTGTSTLLVDSTATVTLDVGEAHAERLDLEVADSSFDLYLRHDTSLPEAVNAYSELTGRMPLPPEWALGFQQCRYSYFPDTRVLEVAHRLREEQIPADVIYLDIHYMDGYRVFTWDRERFPNPASMVAALRDRGFRVVTIVDPGVKADSEYSVFTDGVARDVFLREPTDGPYLGTVWPGQAVFPDFTDQKTRDWWADWLSTLLDAGVDGVWNDMNEPADFSGDPVYRPHFSVPDRIVARNDGHGASMATLHNAYANAMNEATRDGFARHRSRERGFVLTRAGYAGVQRSAAVWTGDNHSWWEHIGLMMPMLMNISLSGVPFTGGDVGGFQQNASGELYARWIAAASLTPFFRAHSALDTQDHEPWSFGETVTAVARRFVGLRYRLMPYLYTLFEEASRSGSPVMRPLVWEFPRDPRVHNRADSYMVGEAILVAPVGTPGIQERSVYLPAGVWYDLWSGERLVAGDPAHPEHGGRAVAVEAPLDRMPIFLRGGTVIPFETLRQTTAEAGDGVLHLMVLSDEDGTAEGSIYGDAGEGWGFREGAFWRASIAVGGGATELTVEHGDGFNEIRWDRVAVHGPAEVGLLWGNDADEGAKKAHEGNAVLPRVGSMTIDSNPA